MPRKTKNAIALSIYWERLKYKFICPCCNTQLEVNSFTNHAKTKTHKSRMEIFRKDHPDFQECLFLAKVDNLRKLLSKCNDGKQDISAEIKYVFDTDPTTYSIFDIIDSTKQKSAVQHHRSQFQECHPQFDLGVL